MQESRPETIVINKGDSREHSNTWSASVYILKKGVNGQNLAEEWVVAKGLILGVTGVP